MNKKQQKYQQENLMIDDNELDEYISPNSDDKLRKSMTPSKAKKFGSPLS